MQSMFVKQSDAQTAPNLSALEIQADGTLRYSILSKAFIFVFLIPTLVFGVYFGWLVNLTGNAIRFF